jgi:hypothetical protein
MQTTEWYDNWCEQKRFDPYTHKENTMRKVIVSEFVTSLFFPTSQPQREGKNNMRKVMVSMMGTRDGTISGPNGAMHVLAMTSNTIWMRRNGGNRR